MVERSVRSACDRGSKAPVSMASLRMGDQNLLSRATPCFERHIKPLVPVAFAIVSTHGTTVSRKVDVRQAAGRKNNCRIFITT
jgi:hypothetical protein